MVKTNCEPILTLGCPRSFHHQKFSTCFYPGNMFLDVWTLYRNRTEMTDKIVPMWSLIHFFKVFSDF